MRMDDRLSGLPDDLIFKILYFIRFKDVIGTGILSPRWSCFSLFKIPIAASTPSPFLSLYNRKCSDRTSGTTVVCEIRPKNGGADCILPPSFSQRARKEKMLADQPSWGFFPIPYLRRNSISVFSCCGGGNLESSNDGSCGTLNTDSSTKKQTGRFWEAIRCFRLGQ
ncbi:hypothetical protein L1987_37427 [Smallanthus sonchifolius]|uniref:Uncharacterized protein n=1 Tax=Smallanthus sonchifolius TaxID=185202 RepID=A0ACB9HH70_9ASTR|nr:hypothetical protein L1987_37427 [Smallanthus sonchifolius]